MKRAGAMSVALAVALTAGACSLGTKERLASRFNRLPAALASSRYATGQLAIAGRLDPKAGLTTAGAAAAHGARQVVTVAIDFSRNEARYSNTGAPAGSPRVDRLFDGLHLYGLRPDARPDEARPWVTVNIAKLRGESTIDPVSTPPTASALAISPIILVDLIGGALAGSIRSRGVDMVAGTPADHFSANFDIDKALHKSSRKAYSDKARLHVQALLTALGVKTLIQPGELWLAPNGSPRRFLLHLQEQPLTHVKELVDLDLTFDDPGRPAELSMPAADQLVEVDLLHQFLQATGAAGATDR